MPGLLDGQLPDTRRRAALPGGADQPQRRRRETHLRSEDAGGQRGVTRSRPGTPIKVLAPPLVAFPSLVHIESPAYLFRERNRSPFRRYPPHPEIGLAQTPPF